ncbi:MAG: zinc-binding dehydrogenase [Acidimicrobiia bacterium]|nr:zinc-binding dehydrogenase [Acidimicrobiia bacterium]
MRAAVTPAAKTPIETRTVPDPAQGDGEVLVSVRATSVNRLDRAVWLGVAMGGIDRFPLIQGIDAAGVVVTGSDAVPEGTRVVVKPAVTCGTCRWCASGREANCPNQQMHGIHRQGGFADLIAVPEGNAVPLRDELSFIEGTAAAHSHAVVMRMIRAAGDLPPDPVVLVTGATGSLGSAALQICSALGIRTIGVASSEEKREVATSLGASHVGPSQGFADQVRAVTDGAGADLVLDTTGHPEVIAEGLGATARGGRVALVGATPGSRVDLDVLGLYRNRQAVLGSSGSHVSDFVDVFDLLADHGLSPLISATYGLDEAAAAMDAVGDRDRIGKVVIEMGSRT